GHAAAAGAGASSFERHFERPGGGFAPDTAAAAAHRGGDRASLGGREQRRQEDQQRPDSGRRDLPPDVRDWEGGHQGARGLSSPPVVMLPMPGEGGVVAPGGMGFEGASTPPASGSER
ncbi:unnamed protein product, partial [Laminaria digitata]